MINAYETEDGVVFDMSNLECEALRSYADGLLADPEHPFVELLRSQGLIVGDAPVPASCCSPSGVLAGDEGARRLGRRPGGMAPRHLLHWPALCRGVAMRRRGTVRRRG